MAIVVVRDHWTDRVVGHGHYGWRQQQKSSRRRLGIARQDHYDWLVVDVDWKGLACIVVDVDWKGLACSGC